MFQIGDIIKYYNDLITFFQSILNLVYMYLKPSLEHTNGIYYYLRKLTALNNQLTEKQCSILYDK